MKHLNIEVLDLTELAATDAVAIDGGVEPVYDEFGTLIQTCTPGIEAFLPNFPKLLHL